jgi:crotonobetainyl-CoA:carnitine CoA-transferase CaiB-like acyl-CoA transferase
MKALSGIKVLDFSQGAAGPYASMVLGDFGADIIKVEPPNGDWGRTLGPPFLEGEGVTYLSLNRNKRSLGLNLKSEEGIQIAKKLVKEVDVLLASFRPGVLDNLGLGYEDIEKINSKIIYCDITGFGQKGPWRNKPGVDGILQALSGFMSVTGVENTEPAKGGTIIADLMAGSLAANGILLALYELMRSGKGQKVDISLLEAMLTIQSPGLAMYFASGKLPKRNGSHAPYAVPNGAIKTKDGYVMVAANLPDKWKNFCLLIDKEEWLYDLRFSTNENRVMNKDILMNEIEEIFKQKNTSEWLPLLEANDILCSPIATYKDLLDFDHIKENEMFIDSNHPVVGKYKQVGIPQKLSRTSGSISTPPPLLGQHTVEILREFQYSEEDIKMLEKNGAILIDETVKSKILQQ